MQTYRTLNEDYMQQAGIQATIPFAVGDWWNAQTRFIGAWQREKDSDFYDIPFDSKLLVNGMIRSKGIQGNYDLPASGNLDASLRWGFAGGRGLLNIFCSDIFQTRTICAYQLQGLAQGRSRPHLEVRRLHGETPRGRGYGEVQAVGIHKHG